ncbi:hypothetical protein BGZ97_011483 [Linnemannia gamsii]|jgi:chromosome segregation ATPase|uniref:Uncharacterized protein n=1 Tax=Linnemannia gamsii TaxID=64522 RepID=A0A9P6R515_9FUNG|nr:hypothetical protein BGZ97_011483 [Linnemannia gamsii]
MKKDSPEHLALRDQIKNVNARIAVLQKDIPIFEKMIALSEAQLQDLSQDQNLRQGIQATIASLNGNEAPSDELRIERQELRQQMLRNTTDVVAILKKDLVEDKARLVELQARLKALPEDGIVA